jgi:hypothetical protein
MEWWRFKCGTARRGTRVSERELCDLPRASGLPRFASAGAGWRSRPDVRGGSHVWRRHLRVDREFEQLPDGLRDMR